MKFSLISDVEVYELLTMKVPSEDSSNSSGSFDDNEYIKSLLSNDYCLSYPDSPSLDTRSDTLMIHEDSNESRRVDIQNEQIQNIVNTFETYEASNWKQQDSPLSSLEETDKHLNDLLHWTTEYKKYVKEPEEAQIPKKPKFSFVEQFKTHEEEKKKSEKCLKANYESRAQDAENIAAVLKTFPQYGMSCHIPNENIMEQPCFDIPEKISYPTTSVQTRLDVQSWLNSQDRSIKSEPEDDCRRNKSSSSEDYYSELFDHLKLDNNLFSAVPLESPSSTTSSLTVASPICSPNKTLPPMVPGTRKFDVENFGFVKHNFHRQPRQVRSRSFVL